MKKIITNWYAKILIAFFVLMLVDWLYINLNNLQNTNENFIYGVMLGVLPLIAAFFGFINMKKWGGFSSAIGRTIAFLSAGLVTWGIGTLIFADYNLFLNVAVPYPSVADAFYIISWILWAISMKNLSTAMSVKFQLRKLFGRLLLFIIPIVTIILSYYILIVFARAGVVVDYSSNWIKTFFDLAYPVGDVIILTIALLIYGLSFNALGGFFKWPIIIILSGFVLNYLGDFLFVYTTTKGTYFVADWVDLIYTGTFLLLGLGVSLIDPILFNKYKN